MHLYHANFSNTHDPRPQLEMRGNKLYGTIHNAATVGSSRALPWFEVKGDKIYTTAHNPQGHSLHPWYEIRDNKVYQTVNHPEGMSHVPTFHIK